jgi:Tfp pilus assembly protein PilV
MKSKAGFTLLELMITAGILVVAVTGLLAAFINASFLSQANHNKVIAVNDAQYVLEKLKNLDYDSLVSYTDGNFSNLNAESIIVTVTVPSANLKNVVANVTWTEGQRQRSFALTTQFAG